jgi:dTDP-4-dehydrorhamnose reductase
MSVPPILVTGGNGQLATALARQTQVAVRHTGRPEFDFDRPESIEAVFKAASPWLVINAAAHTAVDAAETDQDAAYRANRDGPALLARLCADAGAVLVHVSTDYVFDGAKGAPYTETDPVAPQGVYGASKLAGEQAVLASGARAIILRTSWVYSPWGRNFVRTMLNAGKTRDRLTVVADQKGCPTTAGDLADAILAITTRLRDGWREEYACVYHAAGSGWTTWHGLAVAVFEEGARHGQRAPVVDPIATADWPTPAKRPADSRLDCTRLAQVFGVRLPDWRSSVGPVVDAILGSG